MQSVATKKYVKSLIQSVGIDKIEEIAKILCELSLFYNDKLLDLIRSPIIKKADKENFIISLTNIKNKEVINLIRLLSAKNRLAIIPSIYDELERAIRIYNNEYELCIYSSFKLTKKDLDEIRESMQKRLGVRLYVTQKKMEAHGIRLFVDGISVEITLLRDNVINSLKNYILKAF